MIFNENTKSCVAVTIIVPVFNEERFIGRCIRSIISQKFPRDKYEIIVVNDGSIDNTAYALSIFKDQITIINNERNMGLPASLNKALKQTSSPYFVRVDGDDYVSSLFLAFLYSYIDENSYMDAVSCDYNMINEIGAVIERKNCQSSPIGCGIIFRTDQIINIGMYDESFLLHEEKDLRIRFLDKYKIYRLELPLYRYRRHDCNITNDKNKDMYYTNNLELKHEGNKCE